MDAEFLFQRVRASAEILIVALANEEAAATALAAEGEESRAFELWRAARLTAQVAEDQYQEAVRGLREFVKSLPPEERSLVMDQYERWCEG